ncbi:hypothetical protein L5515_017047 [Caenorhabditis briggsae]|uniref:Uncharacterized protein n=1 Tax=Caenorhabditis briggsae TaxID=6238 RepID=A0AAE9FD52_CAEBR|nr:hypothetical protein L5515_017047 [Caenorhabditis briggsae]
MCASLSTCGQEMATVLERREDRIIVDPPRHCRENDPAYVINPYYATLFDDDGLDAPEWHMVQLQKQMLVTT